MTPLPHLRCLGSPPLCRTYKLYSYTNTIHPSLGVAFAQWHFWPGLAHPTGSPPSTHPLVVVVGKQRRCEALPCISQECGEREAGLPPHSARPTGAALWCNAHNNNNNNPQDRKAISCSCCCRTAGWGTGTFSGELPSWQLSTQTTQHPKASSQSTTTSDAPPPRLPCRR